MNGRWHRRHYPDTVRQGRIRFKPICDRYKTFVDNYRTPHTSKLHVVERLKLIEGGKTVQISMTVDDPGAFAVPWSATQRWRRVTRGPITEEPCNENNTDHFNHSLIPTPTAAEPDF